MTVRVDWAAGNANAWTQHVPGIVHLFIAGELFTLTPTDARDLAADLIKAALEAQQAKKTP